MQLERIARIARRSIEKYSRAEIKKAAETVGYDHEPLWGSDLENELTKALTEAIYQEITTDINRILTSISCK